MEMSVGKPVSVDVLGGWRWEVAVGGSRYGSG
jgi:hypothetical protein